MRIGYIATSIWRSVHMDMAKALQARGHQVVVYTEDASVPTIASFTRRSEEGVDIYGIHHEKRNPWLWLPDRLFKPLLGRRFFTTLFAIYRFLRVSRCDIYWVEGDWLGVFPALLRRVLSFRWIVSVHDHEYIGVRLHYPGEPSSRWREPLKRWVLRSADAIRTNSHVTRDILMRGGIASGAIDVIPLHFTPRMRISGALDRFRMSARQDISARHQLEANCELLLVACRLTPIKGLELALNAFAAVQTQRPRARLLICGGDRTVGGIGSYRALLEHLAEECGIRHKVIFAGNVPSDEMKRYYAAADLHLVTSYIETFNYSAIESALTGTPTIMTDRVGSGHWLSLAGVALVVPGREISDFAAAINQGLLHWKGHRDADRLALSTAHELDLVRLAGDVEDLLERTLAASDIARIEGKRREQL